MASEINCASFASGIAYPAEAAKSICLKAKSAVDSPHCHTFAAVARPEADVTSPSRSACLFGTKRSNEPTQVETTPPSDQIHCSGARMRGGEIIANDPAG